MVVTINVTRSGIYVGISNLLTRVQKRVIFEAMVTAGLAVLKQRGWIKLVDSWVEYYIETSRQPEKEFLT